jgi:hypothetical protein
MNVEERGRRHENWGIEANENYIHHLILPLLDHIPESVFLIASDTPKYG